MSETPDMISPAPPGEEFRPGPDQGFPTNWKEAIATLASARMAMIKAESGEAIGTGVKKLALVIIGVVALFFAWCLFMGGVVGAIASSPALSWWQAAFIVGGGHLLVALVAFLVAKSKASDPFPITRAEFEKDREWLNQLKNQSKSQN